MQLPLTFVRQNIHRTAEAGKVLTTEFNERTGQCLDKGVASQGLTHDTCIRVHTEGERWIPIDKYNLPHQYRMWSQNLRNTQNINELPDHGQLKGEWKQILLEVLYWNAPNRTSAKTRLTCLENRHWTGTNRRGMVQHVDISGHATLGEDIPHTTQHPNIFLKAHKKPG